MLRLNFIATVCAKVHAIMCAVLPYRQRHHPPRIYRHEVSFPTDYIRFARLTQEQTFSNTYEMRAIIAYALTESHLVSSRLPTCAEMHVAELHRRLYTLVDAILTVLQRDRVIQLYIALRAARVIRQRTTPAPPAHLLKYGLIQHSRCKTSDDATRPFYDDCAARAAHLDSCHRCELRRRRSVQ